jgi:hypothetical protein
MDPYRGGQEQYPRVPYAGFNALKLSPGIDYEADFVLLADVFPTAIYFNTIAHFLQYTNSSKQDGTASKYPASRPATVSLSSALVRSV